MSIAKSNCLLYFLFCFLIKISFCEFLFAQTTKINCHKNCQITPSNSHQLTKPQKFHRNNNLLKKSNNNHYAFGEIMILEGYIVNQNCTPINNAIVKIWQKNNFGFYQQFFNPINLPKNASKIQEKMNLYNTNFTSNGMTVTNNIGYFKFTTLVPCNDVPTSVKCIPNIEISVSSPDHIGLETNILIPEIDRCSHNKLLILNNHNYPENFIAEFKCFDPKNKIKKYRYDMVLYAKNYYRKY